MQDQEKGGGRGGGGGGGRGGRILKSDGGYEYMMRWEGKKWGPFGFLGGKFANWYLAMLCYAVRRCGWLDLAVVTKWFLWKAKLGVKRTSEIMGDK